MFSAFLHHRHLGLLSERSQMIQFFIQPAHTLSSSRLGEQLHPLLSLFLLIDGRTGCPDSVRAIDRFDSNHCVVSSNVICSRPLKLRRSRITAAASVATIVSNTTLPSASRTATTVVAWCRSKPIYLSYFIERPLLYSTRLR